MRKHLYLQIYGAFLALVVLCLIAGAITARVLHDDWGEVPDHLRRAAVYVAADLPSGGPELEAALAERARLLSLNMTLLDEQQHILASAHAPEQNAELVGSARWIPRHAQGPGVVVQLPDGRSLSATLADFERDRFIDHLLMLGLFLSVIGLGAYPVARRITRRLERLQQGVQELGAGDLEARVPVEGCDEVSRLAHNFNRTAARIGQLVEGQRRMLAGASHELRSPLARLRLAVELMGEGADPAMFSEAVRDINELDALIDELLMAARLESGETQRRVEAVELLDLAVEEGARVEAQVGGEPVRIQGDRRMLARMLRNLLENARRYGGDGPVEIEVRVASAKVCIAVLDRGPGVPDDEVESIFEPFYRGRGHSEKDGGVGLGLALVKRIATEHGGQVSYGLRADGGSRFEVCLPRSMSPV